MSKNNWNYVRVIPPDDYPGKLYQGRYALEHRVVWWGNTGSLPGPDEVIHHINGDQKDNRFENLELKFNIEHSREHSTTGRTMVDLICPICEKQFTKERRQTHLVKKRNKSTCCSRSCSAKKSNMV